MEENDKIALITGGSRGLDKNMALSLAKKGINVLLTYNSKQEEAQAVVTEIERLGVKAFAVQLDTGNTNSFDDFFVKVQAILKDTFGKTKFDFLINNAGIGVYSSFADT